MQKWCLYRDRVVQSRDPFTVPVARYAYGIVHHGRNPPELPVMHVGSFITDGIHQSCPLCMYVGSFITDGIHQSLKVLPTEL